MVFRKYVSWRDTFPLFHFLLTKDWLVKAYVFSKAFVGTDRWPSSETLFNMSPCLCSCPNWAHLQFVPSQPGESRNLCINYVLAKRKELRQGQSVFYSCWDIVSPWRTLSWNVHVNVRASDWVSLSKHHYRFPAPFVITLIKMIKNRCLCSFLQRSLLMSLQNSLT